MTETQQLLRDNLSPELTPLLDEYTNAQTQLATRLYAGRLPFWTSTPTPKLNLRLASMPV
ncbi:hypothetical protein [Sodalinema gerasimenkoae]|uniref:hypothetical protein n=1 Tax=Sodalinema gerasimenkoae TaxID=2862348 RepID=UPI001FE7B7CD|nr:hypothetical protein [Sodalinema gerasimenkoae]